MFKTVIVLLLLVIVISLFAAMVFMVRDHGNSNRPVKALTVRITLSLLLFGLLFVGYFSGALKPHGIIPFAPPETTSSDPGSNDGDTKADQSQ
jgi:ABC-type iron transport system FetAB permease component